MFDGSGMTAGSGMGMGGAAISAYGGYRAGKARKKAAKAQMKMLQNGLNQFKAGSTDAYGNKLSADGSGNWNYKLTNPTKQAVTAANRANIVAGTTNGPSRSEQMRNNLAGMNKAANVSALANQSAALKNAARSGSNLGMISSSAAAQGSRNMRNMYQNAIQNAKNSAMNNANLANSLASAQQNTAAPVQNMQSNLQGMVNSLNGAVMNQYNQMAGATANPYAHGMATADLIKGIGSAMSGTGQNMQNQQNYQDKLALLKAIYGA